ncbi:MAG TPA: serine/threonine-protein kinase [Myxococcales bacterium]|nr:serine/threonine-protein kinase [Myxococcales bacterium]
MTTLGAANPQASAMEPVPFGKYLLLDRIAVGGMAEIFLARQAEGPDKKLVIKRIRPHLSRQTAFVKMFLNEAKLAAQLNHPNVVQIYDLGKIGESYFIAMEHIFGRDMRRIIPKADSMGIPFPMVYALKIASCVCEGLSYAHQKHDQYGNPLHIVHRDITPENVMVSFEGAVKILDFGIAKAQNQIEQSRAGEIKGKLSYMSPEQCQGFGLDQRSDLFSLGAVLYEWVTGYQLFTGDSEVAILKSITEGKIYSPSYFKADIPDAVETILMRALEKDRDKRYQTAWDMQSDLDRFLAEYDFTPTGLHLANFLKQVFQDELAEGDAKISLPLDPDVTPSQPRPSVAMAPRPALPDERRPTVEITAELGVAPEPPTLATLDQVAETPGPPGPTTQELPELPEIPELPPEPGSREITARTTYPEPPGPPVEDQKTPIGVAGDERVLNVTVSRAEADQLEHVARRNGLSVANLAREILAAWLKYR